MVINSSTPEPSNSKQQHALLLLGLLALCLFTTVLSAHAQTITDSIAVSLDVESVDIDGVSCTASVLARFDDVPGAISYTLHGWDPLFWGTPFTISGPPFDDDFAVGQTPVPPPSGMHQFGLSGASGECGSTIAYVESWIEDRFDYGGYDWRVVVVREEQDPPDAVFTWQVNADSALAVDLDASSSSDPDGEIVSYEWDFGDGETGDGEQVNHAYEEEGTYTVTLTVTDDDDQQDTTSEEVEVKALRWRYEVSLKLAGAVGKRMADDPVEAEVGDTVLVVVKVENTGLIPLEEIQIANGAQGIDIISEVEEPLVLTEARQAMIDRLEPDTEGELVYAYEAAHAVASFGVFVSKVEAVSVDPTTGEREPVSEEVTSCAAGGKRTESTDDGDDDNVGCAEGSVKKGQVVVNATGDAGRGVDGEGNPLKGCDTGNELVTMRDGRRRPECTLRAAIEAVNAGDVEPDESGMPKVIFDIPAISPTITVLASPLILEKAAEIDGTTQEGYNADTGQLAIAILGTSESGLIIKGEGSIVRGIAIGTFSQAGILVQAARVLIEKNYIGTDRTGSIAKPNGIGILIDNVPKTQVRENLISGNTNDGLKIMGTNATQTTVEGNIAGANKELTEVMANKLDIAIFNAPANTIGGETVAARNYLTGTIRIWGEEATDNMVLGNYIGTNRDGTQVLGWGKIASFGTQRTSIGSSSGVGNLIAGGISLSGAGNRAEGNLIGLQPDGESQLEHSSCNWGIELNLASNLPDHPVIKNNRIAYCKNGLFVQGGVSSLIVSNTIFFNREAGVVINRGAQGQTIRTNAIYKNGGLGIDHHDDSITFNDGFERDGVQNYPVLNAVTATADGVRVVGSIPTQISLTSHTYTLEFFSNRSCDYSSTSVFRYGEGEHALGTTTATNNFSGNAPFEFITNNLEAGHQYITATATNEEGQTSEFSRCLPIADANQMAQADFDPNATGPILAQNGVRVTATGATASKTLHSTATLYATRYETSPDTSLFSGTSATTNSGSIIIPDALRPRYFYLATSGLADNEGNPLALTYDLCLDATNTISSLLLDHLLLVYRSEETGGLWTPLNTYIVQEGDTRYACSNSLTSFGEFGFATGGVTSLNTPTLVWPEDGSEDVPLNTDLTWETVPDALSYDLQLALNPSFTTTLVDTTGLSGTALPYSTQERIRVHYWRVRGIAATGEVGPWSSTHRFTSAVTGVALEEEAEVPTGIVLAANYPNPFNPQTTIPFALPESMRIRLVVYDMLGRAVRVLVDESLPAGRHEAVFEAGRLPSGVYLYRLEVEGQAFTRRMLLLK